MAIRSIRIIDQDDVLRKHARKVEKFDERLHTLLNDMAETMAAGNGVGLAAPQVGVLKRCCVIDVGEGVTVIEGCQSVPDRAGKVVRPEKVKVKAQDRNGEPIEVEGEGILAVCLCHELDHLDGILYVDKMIEDATEEMRQKSGGDAQ